ncbi:S-Ena type endospore appendage [Bacillus sp. JJ864]|uniref:S-Ena type endospore appendage n=1 Tax=Bacillus sp. JJ864 TaxID=3122975 RepID=UPI00300039BD
MTRNLCNSMPIHYPIGIPCSFPVPICDPPQKPQEECKVVCNDICGNFLLRDNFTFLKVWEKKVHNSITGTVTVYNDIQSSLVEVNVEHHTGNPILFTIPPGNSVSKTIQNIKAITIRLIEPGSANGKFCLDICFAIDC